MPYRYEIEHAPANLDSAEGGAVLIDEARSEAVWVYKWGSRELRLVAVLTSSFVSLAFSKYRRAQTTPIIDPYCFIRFSLLVSTVLPFTDFR